MLNPLHEYFQPIPHPKISGPTECKHFRPISISCVPGKVLDKVVYRKMSEYISDMNILYKHQSGYGKSFSAQTTLIKIMDDIRLN